MKPRQVVALLLAGFAMLGGDCGDPVVDPCQQQRARYQELSDELQAAIQERDDAANDLNNRGPGDPDKARIADEVRDADADIRRIQTELASAEQELRDCRQRNNQSPSVGDPDYRPPQPLNSTFSGTAALRTTKSDPTPPPSPLPFSGRLRFDVGRTGVEVLGFNDIDTNDATISFVTATPGSLSCPGGTLMVQVTVKIDIKSIVASDPNDEPLDLTTGGASAGNFSDSGSALDTGGAIKLVAAGNFDGGTLGGDPYLITLRGTIAPNPCTS